MDRRKIIKKSDVSNYIDSGLTEESEEEVF